MSQAFTVILQIMFLHRSSSAEGAKCMRAGTEQQRMCSITRNQ